MSAAGRRRLTATVMDIRIRPLERRDYSAWESLFQGYLVFYESSLPKEQVDLTFERLLSDAPDAHLGFVASDETGTAIGFAHILFHRSTWSPTEYCYLEDLFVSPACRAKGIGQRLIERVYAEADERGCTRTYWMTQEFNERARGLYDKLAAKSPFVQYRR